MRANPRDVRTGILYIDGDVAAAEGALAAGCKFVGGYPITPSTEAAEAFVRRAPQVGAMFIQMEDELGSISAVMGASLSGKKSMTITSGPGFSLMMETIGFGAMLEIPFVIINIQRGGPSTGVPTKTGQADMMQARWGSQGDYEVITLSPDSPQESFDFTIKAFNLAEKYRVPVMLMSDECVGHMTEKVVVPEADKIEIEPRRLYKGPKDKYVPFKPDKDLVPPMVKAGDGYKLYLSALTHNERGYPTQNIKNSSSRRLIDKIRLNADDIIEIKEEGLEDAEVVVVSYGITSRVAFRAIEQARKLGIKVGNLRLVTVWPFPDKKITELSKKVKGFVVPEINYGQVVFEVERCVHGNANIILVPHGGASVHNPNDILTAIKTIVKDKKRYDGILEFKTELELRIFGSGDNK
ncbi:2-oxoacid:acceptor oxidoreductase subunit alpha [candidate division WOR-3 bacterium]|nr:2-oxoacid:acceptor oxidoreductase subunit alpha [candidate division WOR-3 bacterium]MCK4574813.1 2-oxoacid:acceptor oxidoreductase subunit alpha [candidate division WOR-3 bacterium]